LAHRLIIPWNINSFITIVATHSLNRYNVNEDTNRKLMLIDKLTMNNEIKLGNILNIQVDVDAKHGAAQMMQQAIHADILTNHAILYMIKLRRR
jgi:hypothetical protein